MPVFFAWWLVRAALIHRENKGGTLVDTKGARTHASTNVFHDIPPPPLSFLGLKNAKPPRRSSSLMLVWMCRHIHTVAFWFSLVYGHAPRRSALFAPSALHPGDRHGAPVVSSGPAQDISTVSGAVPPQHQHPGGDARLGRRRTHRARAVQQGEAFLPDSLRSKKLDTVLNYSDAAVCRSTVQSQVCFAPQESKAVAAECFHLSYA